MPTRPNESGVIINPIDMYHATQGHFYSMQEAGLVPLSASPDDIALQLFECRKDALLGLRAYRIRSWFRKHIWKFAFAIPCGLDLVAESSAEATHLRAAPSSNLFVWWETEEQERYANLLQDWWR